MIVSQEFSVSGDNDRLLPLLTATISPFPKEEETVAHDLAADPRGSTIAVARLTQLGLNFYVYNLSNGTTYAINRPALFGIAPSSTMRRPLVIKAGLGPRNETVFAVAFLRYDAEFVVLDVGVYTDRIGVIIWDSIPSYTWPMTYFDMKFSSGRLFVATVSPRAVSAEIFDFLIPDSPDSLLNFTSIYIDIFHTTEYFDNAIIKFDLEEDFAYLDFALETPQPAQTHSRWRRVVVNYPISYDTFNPLNEDTLIRSNILHGQSIDTGRRYFSVVNVSDESSQSMTFFYFGNPDSYDVVAHHNMTLMNFQVEVMVSSAGPIYCATYSGKSFFVDRPKENYYFCSIREPMSEPLIIPMQYSNLTDDSSFRSALDTSRRLYA